MRFDGVRVPPRRVVGDVGGAAAAVERQLQLAIVLQCAETVGALDRVLEFTLEYLADRSSFGRPLASYQAIKHRFADMKMWLEASHGVTELAARAVQDDDPEAAEIVSAAAAYLGDHATEIVQECVQLHGGIGVTWEHDLHLYLRRVTLDRNLFGTPAQHRERIAAHRCSTDEPEAAPCLTSARWRASSRSACGRGRGWPSTCRASPPTRRPPTAPRTTQTWVRDRELQRMLWDGGFAGICFPKEYGGLGLTIEHQHAFTEESLPYEMPLHLNVPNFSILGATLLDFGTDEQKAKYLPPMLTGEHQWVQFLSEPTGGSDLAGCVTRADRDGDEWVLNGSKIWSTAAMSATHAMCLARTDWDVPKHRGLTMFIVEIHQPGVQVDPIKQVNGSLEFCQEFFDDVRLPPDSVVGDVNDGWTRRAGAARPRAQRGRRRVALRERSQLPRRGCRRRASTPARSTLVTARGTADEPVARQLVAEAHVLDVVQRGLVRRVSARHGERRARRARPRRSPSSSPPRRPSARPRSALDPGRHRRGHVAGRRRDARARGGRGRSSSARPPSLAGGSNEIQRNIIAERVLGMPREWAADRDMPYKDVRRNAMPTAPSGA